MNNKKHLLNNVASATIISHADLKRTYLGYMKKANKEAIPIKYKARGNKSVTYELTADLLNTLFREGKYSRAIVNYLHLDKDAIPLSNDALLIEVATLKDDNIRLQRRLAAIVRLAERGYQ